MYDANAMNPCSMMYDDAARISLPTAYRAAAHNAALATCKMTSVGYSIPRVCFQAEPRVGLEASCMYPYSFGTTRCSRRASHRCHHPVVTIAPRPCHRRAEACSARAAQSSVSTDHIMGNCDLLLTAAL